MKNAERADGAARRTDTERLPDRHGVRMTCRVQATPKRRRLVVRVPMRFKRRGGRKTIIILAPPTTAPPNADDATDADAAGTANDAGHTAVAAAGTTTTEPLKFASRELDDEPGEPDAPKGAVAVVVVAGAPAIQTPLPREPLQREQSPPEPLPQAPPLARAPLVQAPLVQALARAHHWQALLDHGRYTSIHGRYTSITALAQVLDLDRSYVSRTLRLTLLAPDIIEAILQGAEPSGLSLAKLTRSLPASWAKQRKMLGFAAVA